MKMLLKVLILFMFLSSSTVIAQTAFSSATANVEVTIITPLTITKLVDMNFGNIISGVSPGTVVLDVLDNRNPTGGVTLPTTIPGTITSARFLITGMANATFNIQIPTQFTISDGVNIMNVNNFVISSSTVETLDNTGQREISVGATLEVNGNQPHGLYSNTTDIEITVAYN